MISKTNDSRHLRPQDQFRCFIESTFLPNDLVEIRAFINEVNGRSRVVEREWIRAEVLASKFNWLENLNARKVNVHFGVNPRSERGGKKSSITHCRFIWADFDNMDGPEAMWRITPVLPMPNTVIESGHGIHMYWKLDEPYSVVEPSRREHFERVLKAVYAKVGADSTSDVTRLMRLPGFINHKREPVPCRLISCNQEATHGFDQFHAPLVEQNTNRLANESIRRATRTGTKRQRPKNVNQVLSELDSPSDDRSRRDFRVVCRLLRNGLTEEEIWENVRDRSKFATHGRAYFDVTIKNALRQVHEAAIHHEY